MAKFVYDDRGQHPTIRLDAKHDEEVSTEMVAAWAAMRQAWALDQIADNLIGIDNALASISGAISDR